jgi:AcrR family transcriptional regulator
MQQKKANLLKNSQDPRVLRTRKLLREALIALIPEKGFDAITVQDITERATLNRATFYLHYTDKQMLLDELVQSILHDLGEIPVPPFTLDLNPEQASRIFIHLFDHAAKHAAFYQVMLGDGSVASVATKMEEAIQQIGLRWLSQAQINWKRLPLPAEIIISYLASAWLGAVKWWLNNDMPYTSTYMAQVFMEMTVFGLHRTLGVQAPETKPPHIGGG